MRPLAIQLLRAGRLPGRTKVEVDIANLKAGAGDGELFITAASPGIIALFMPNRHYRNNEEYLFALADAMKQEYDAIHQAGVVLQLDCPDLAGWGWCRRQTSAVPQGGRPAPGGPRPCHQGHPGGPAADACVLGQCRGAAPHRRPVRRLRRPGARRPAGRYRSKAPTRGTSTSGRYSRT